MTRKGDKQEPPLHIEMDFGEALERFGRTDPKQVEASIKRAKQKKAGPPKKAPGKSVAGKKGDKGG